LRHKIPKLFAIAFSADILLSAIIIKFMKSPLIVSGSLTLSIKEFLIPNIYKSIKLYYKLFYYFLKPFLIYILLYSSFVISLYVL